MKRKILTLIVSLLTCSTLFSPAVLAKEHDNGHRLTVHHQNVHQRAGNRGHYSNQNHSRFTNSHHERGNIHRARDSHNGHEYRANHHIERR